MVFFCILRLGLHAGHHTGTINTIASRANTASHHNLYGKFITKTFQCQCGHKWVNSLRFLVFAPKKRHGVEFFVWHIVIISAIERLLLDIDLQLPQLEVTCIYLEPLAITRSFCWRTSYASLADPRSPLENFSVPLNGHSFSANSNIKQKVQLILHWIKKRRIMALDFFLIGERQIILRRSGQKL